MKGFLMPNGAMFFTSRIDKKVLSFLEIGEGNDSDRKEYQIGK